MEVYRGYRFRIYPTKRQEQVIEQIIHSCSFVYNYFINEQKRSYENSGKYLSVSQCIKKLPSLKEEYPQLRNGESTSLQQTIRHLDRAYKNFFDRSTRYPRYKSYDLIGNSYTCTKNGRTPSNIRIEGDRLILPKLGGVKVNWHHRLPENSDITSATVRVNYSGKYEVSIQLKKQVEVKEEQDYSIVGIVYHPDLFFIASDGSHGLIPESYKKAQKRIVKVKRQLKRREEGSSNWKKDKLKLKKAIEKAQNIKKDFLHKWSKELTDGHNVVIVKEIDPNIFNTRTSSKEGWNQFQSFLKYKVEEKGGTFIEVKNDELPNDQRITELSYSNGLKRAKKLIEFIGLENKDTE